MLPSSGEVSSGRRTRVAYLSVSGGLGGSEMALLALLKGLQDAALAFDLSVILGSAGPLAERIEMLGVPVYVLPFPAAISRLGESRGKGIHTYVRLVGALFSIAGYAWKLRKLVRRIGPDVVHSNGLKMHFLSVCSVGRRRALIWHVHDYVGRRAITRRLLRWGSGKVRAVICNSLHVKADVASAGIRRPEILTIYNGIDTERFCAAGSGLDLDRVSGLPAAAKGTVRVGLLGTFARWKGHEVFLRALGLLGEQAAVRGYVIGAPIYQTDGSQFSTDELKGLCARLCLSDRVGFTGFADAADALRALDIVVHASTEPEPFGMVIAEALACGKAVVASRAGGAQEIFSERVSALAHTPGDPQELAARLAELVRDPGLRGRLGAEGAAGVRERFSLARCANETASLYHRILENPVRVS